MPQIIGDNEEVYVRRERLVGTWELDIAMWCHAQELLELSTEVTMKRVSGQQLYGRCRWRRNKRTGKMRHDITIQTQLSAKRASKTIWHELIHCQQREKIQASRGTDNPMLEFDASESIYGYDNCPYEKEANERAEYLTERFPLTLDTTGKGKYADA